MKKLLMILVLLLAVTNVSGHTPKMHPRLSEMLRRLSNAVGYELKITSAYRSRKHPIEAKKSMGGQHTLGRAVDIRVPSDGMRYKILREAFKLGFTGIGVGRNFIHLDIRRGKSVVWTY